MESRRWSSRSIYDSIGTKQIDISTQFSPRIGLIWDPFCDHKTKVYGSFGYFYEQIPMDLVIREYSYEQQGVIYNFSPTDINLDANAATIAGDAGAAGQGGGKVLGGFTTPSDRSKPEGTVPARVPGRCAARVHAQLGRRWQVRLP